MLLLGIGFEVKVHGLSKFEETVAQAWNTMHYNGYFDLATGNYEWYPTYNFKGNTGGPTVVTGSPNKVEFGHK